MKCKKTVLDQMEIWIAWDLYYKSLGSLWDHCGISII